jgi:hypothetical protein
MSNNFAIELVETQKLLHIEGFSKKRVEWLKAKIIKEGIWNKPVALDFKHSLVLDGQHRMEVALALGLKWIPAVKYDYSKVELWSLRPKYEFDWKIVQDRALTGDIYPYKTVKHKFPESLPSCNYTLEDLKK